TSRWQIRTPSQELTALPHDSGQDFGLEIWLRMEEFTVPGTVQYTRMMALMSTEGHPRCFSSRPVVTPLSISLSTGGSPNGRTSAKSRPQKSRGRRTTTPSITSDIYWSAWVIANLRYRTIRHLLLPSSESWKSILRPSLGSPLATHAERLARYQMASTNPHTVPQWEAE